MLAFVHETYMNRQVSNLELSLQPAVSVENRRGNGKVKLRKVTAK